MARNNDNDISINIGSLFKGIGKFINIVSDMIENGETIREISGNICDPSKEKNLKGMYDIRIQVGDAIKNIGGLQDTNPNKIKPSQGSSDSNPEPIIDIFEEEGNFLIVAELNGFNERDISVDIVDNYVIISALNKERKYKKEVSLPRKICKEKADIKFNNGVLTIVIQNGEVP